eukprot:767702-Hanusia_phi.AAC.1
MDGLARRRIAGHVCCQANRPGRVPARAPADERQVLCGKASPGAGDAKVPTSPIRSELAVSEAKLLSPIEEIHGAYPSPPPLTRSPSRPFQLQPDAPKEGRSKLEMYQEKFGAERVRMMVRRASC